MEGGGGQIFPKIKQKKREERKREAAQSMARIVALRYLAVRKYRYKVPTSGAAHKSCYASKVKIDASSAAKIIPCLVTNFLIGQRQHHLVRRVPRPLI